MSKKTYTLTAESVRRGHPDKLCDQIADGILDAYLRRDPKARVAVEVMASNGRITIAGEVSAGAELLEERVMCDTLERIGYRSADLSDDGELNVTIGIHEQSPDIAQAVARTEMGAGDQGIVVGYATDETPEYLPLPVVLAHRICRLLDEEPLRGAGLDGKAQVTVAYRSGTPAAVTAVVVSVQHAKDADPDALRRDVESRIIRRAIPADLLTKETRLLINPSGRFIKGGPAADTGLTGGGYRPDRAQAGGGPVRPGRAHRRRRALRQGPHQDGPQWCVCGPLGGEEPHGRGSGEALRSADRIRHRREPPGQRDGGRHGNGPRSRCHAGKRGEGGL